MSRPWSELVAQHYGFTLPEDLVAWLDDELWRRLEESDSLQPLTPEEMVDPPPGTIWGGFMLPDTLPIVGNQYGDWICLRAGENGTVDEYLFWSHAGGDWIPFGSSLAEALVFDATHIYRSPHDIAFTRQNNSCEARQVAAQWAVSFLHQSVPEGAFWQSEELSWDVCLAADLGGPALQQQRVLRALSNRMRQECNTHVAGTLGFEWEPDFVRWLFDARQTPAAAQQAVASCFETSFGRLSHQDWETAESVAAKVLTARSDLGWAADIAGWAAEQRGDRRLARQRYRIGLFASAFSDHGVSFRTHWFPEGMGKFAAFRLQQLEQELGDDLGDDLANDPYLRLLWSNDPESIRANVRDHWLNTGEEHEHHGRFLEAYRAYYAAGWDLGLQFMNSYGEILDRMARVAQKAHLTSWASLARLHRVQIGAC